MIFDDFVTSSYMNQQKQAVNLNYSWQVVCHSLNMCSGNMADFPGCFISEGYVFIYLSIRCYYFWVLSSTLRYSNHFQHCFHMQNQIFNVDKQDVFFRLAQKPMSRTYNKLGSTFDIELENQDLAAFFHYKEKNEYKRCFTSLMSSMLSFLGSHVGYSNSAFSCCAQGKHAQIPLFRGILYWGEGIQIYINSLRNYKIAGISFKGNILFKSAILMRK